MYALRTSSVVLRFVACGVSEREHDDAARAHRHFDRGRPVAPALFADRRRAVGERAVAVHAGHHRDATVLGVASVIASQQVRYACGSTYV